MPGKLATLAVWRHLTLASKNINMLESANLMEISAALCSFILKASLTLILRWRVGCPLHLPTQVWKLHGTWLPINLEVTDFMAKAPQHCPSGASCWQTIPNQSCRASMPGCQLQLHPWESNWSLFSSETRGVWSEPLSTAFESGPDITRYHNKCPKKQKVIECLDRIMNHRLYTRSY